LSGGSRSGGILFVEFGWQVNPAVADDFDARVAALDPVASYRERFFTLCDRH
jgi:hypothetical protein